MFLVSWQIKGRKESYTYLVKTVTEYNTAGLVGINASGVLHQTQAMRTRRKRKNIDLENSAMKVKVYIKT